MHTRTHSDWKGLWAVLWRSVVFVPYMLMVFICVGGLWLSRWVLPVYGASLVYLQDWRQAAMVFALWLLVFWVYRRFRLHRFLEAPPSLL